MSGTTMNDHTPTHPAAGMPTVFLGNGATWLADDAIWTKALATWSDDLQTPA